MRTILTVILFSLAAVSCGTGGSNKDMAASPGAKRYPLKGKVVSVDPAAKKAKIEHEPIEGFMDAMTMDFPIRADWVWDDLKPGVDIRADLVVDNADKEPFFLENIGIMGTPNPAVGGAPADPLAALVGKPVPDFALTNQDGKKVSLTDFRGKVLAMTFIYAKCPLPEYCIRMSTNFSDAVPVIQADPDLREKMRLLSISFDPANDTPEKLRSYGIGYMGNDPNAKFDIWQLAVGKDEEVRKVADFFGLKYEVDQNDKALINHSLRTAVIGPDGTVKKVFGGSEWSTRMLLREMEAAAPAKN